MTAPARRTHKGIIVSMTNPALDEMVVLTPAELRAYIVRCHNEIADAWDRDANIALLEAALLAMGETL